MARSEHKCCPFCCGEKLYADQVDLGSVWPWVICCANCAAEGPLAETEASAWRLWDAWG